MNKQALIDLLKASKLRNLNTHEFIAILKAYSKLPSYDQEDIEMNAFEVGIDLGCGQNLRAKIVNMEAAISDHDDHLHAINQLYDVLAKELQEVHDVLKAFIASCTETIDVQA